jgi:hypothetical protein
MPTKVAIIEQIGEKGLLLPELVNRGLAANDRLKYYLTLLQTAQAHAGAPRLPAPNLRIEREASGVSDLLLDRIVEASVDIGTDTLQIPAAETIVKRLFAELRLMLEPLRVAGATRPGLRGRFDIYERRFNDLIMHAPHCHDDQLTATAISGLTGIRENGHDTVHQLAIDLHWELNQLQATVSTETLDGASVYDITDADRMLVRAFMKGIHETAHLKFDHPGLGTTATRSGDRLSIQNDLGTTDAHVLVIHVDGTAITVNYTDVHRPRVHFFHDLLQPYEVEWTATTVAAAEYDMSVGRYSAEGTEGVEQYLRFLGSRLVFLIEWNRARKRLMRLVRKSDALALLKWSADNNVGHRAFLEAGDTRLIDAAIERAAPLQMRSGARLDEWLGRESARSFLMSVLRITSSGLSVRHSLGLIEDEVEAELLRHLQSIDRHSLQGVTDQATLISALAERVARTLLYLKQGEARREANRTAELARTWSTRAEQSVLHSLRVLDRASTEHELRRLVSEGSSAIDALEQAAYLLTLLPDGVDPDALSLLADLGDLVANAVREYVRCLEEGRDLSPGSPRSEVDGFLIAIDRLGDLHHRTSRSERELIETVIRGPGQFHDLYVITNVARGFDQVVKSLARCAVIVRDRVLSARQIR